MTELHDLFIDHGQSPWLDNLRRGWMTDGEMQRWIDQGIRGLTSNPSIFQKAIADSADYDEQFGRLIGDGTSVDDAYWDLVTTDIEAALALLRPVYDASHGLDGYVSVEVDPGLARDTEGTIVAARRLHAGIDEPNLYVKIPATAEGIPAIEQMIAEKRSINVTLIFSLDRYAEVTEAYLAGLERADGDLSTISSVASFFVSRVDTEVDRRLEEAGRPDLAGQLAVANARLAYRHWQDAFGTVRWQELAARGATAQRCLWASTSTKNPAYRDVVYVEELVGPDTVNTMPMETLVAFREHGEVRRGTLCEGLAEAEQLLLDLAAAGVDYDDVVATLEAEGVDKFSDSFSDLLAGIEAKTSVLRAA